LDIGYWRDWILDIEMGVSRRSGSPLSNPTNIQYPRGARGDSLFLPWVLGIGGIGYWILKWASAAEADPHYPIPRISNTQGERGETPCSFLGYWVLAGLDIGY
jgi:hypothetical protein